MVALDVKANTDNTGKAMDFVASELKRYDFTAAARAEILIAVEEIFVNIASYAYDSVEEGDVSLSVAFDGKAIIRFEDSGLPFNPLERSNPDPDIPILERNIGGLGIHFVKNMMDDVEYVYSGGKNILTISKGLSETDRVG